MTALVVDTSALVAITLRERSAKLLAEHMRDVAARFLAAASLVELGIVLEGRSPGGAGLVGHIVRDWELEVVPIDERLTALAIDGFRRFGKGRHRARLNFGDCFTYALARDRGLPVLCVGDDFARTGLEVLGPG